MCLIAMPFPENRRTAANNPGGNHSPARTRGLPHTQPQARQGMAREPPNEKPEVETQALQNPWRLHEL